TGGGEGAADVVLAAVGDEVANHIGIDLAIEHPQLPSDSVGERKVGRRREALDSFPATQDGGPGKAHENRLGEMRVPKRELSLGQRRELDLGCWRKRCVARGA